MELKTYLRQKLIAIMRRLVGFSSTIASSFSFAPNSLTRIWIISTSPFWIAKRRTGPWTESSKMFCLWRLTSMLLDCNRVRTFPRSLVETAWIKCSWSSIFCKWNDSDMVNNSDIGTKSMQNNTKSQDIWQPWGRSDSSGNLCYFNSFQKSYASGSSLILCRNKLNLCFVQDLYIICAFY